MLSNGDKFAVLIAIVAMVGNITLITMAVLIKLAII